MVHEDGALAPLYVFALFVFPSFVFSSFRLFLSFFSFSFLVLELMNMCNAVVSRV